jgi:hypothetical protein
VADGCGLVPSHRIAPGYDAEMTSPYPVFGSRIVAAVPAPIRLLLRHALIGYAVATLFMLAILWRDLFGLATLMLQAPEHPLPLALLWCFIGLTSAGVQMGIAIMAQGMDADDA